MIEEPGDVVLGVAGDDAQAQFVFHIWRRCNASRGSLQGEIDAV